MELNKKSDRDMEKQNGRENKRKQRVLEIKIKTEA